MIDNTVIFTNYTIGQGIYKEIPQVCSHLGQRILVIGGKTALRVIEQPLKRACKDSALEVVAQEWYGGDCTYGNIERLAQIGRSAQAQVILGVGGGKAIDTAKGAAEKLGIPVLTVPTIAATCAAVTALSVVYKEDGSFDNFLFLSRPPHHCFMDSTIIAHAPGCYLRAGIGDALAKHFECTMASRGDELSHSSAIAREISNMCVVPVLKYGLSALNDVKKKLPSHALEQIILANVISTGMVSMLIDEAYNGAVAHSLFYGFTTIPQFEETHLHGDVVAYGVLVQLALDKQLKQLEKIYPFLKGIGMPVSLADLGVDNSLEALETVLKETISGPDMKHLPYEVTTDMVFDGMQIVEAYKG